MGLGVGPVDKGGVCSEPGRETSPNITPNKGYLGERWDKSILEMAKVCVGFVCASVNQGLFSSARQGSLQRPQPLDVDLP